MAIGAGTGDTGGSGGSFDPAAARRVALGLGQSDVTPPSLPGISTGASAWQPPAAPPQGTPPDMGHFGYLDMYGHPGNGPSTPGNPYGIGGDPNGPNLGGRLDFGGGDTFSPITNPGIGGGGLAGAGGVGGGGAAGGGISGVGLGSPGQGEQFYDVTKNQYLDPSKSGAFADQFNKNLPQVMQTPGLDPYYANAERKANEDIDNRMAARGLYGSSAANDMSQEAITNLRAEQANREAQYNLSKLGEERAWQGLGGNLAGQADASKLGLLGAGQNAANSAQGMGLNRFGTAFGAEMGIDNATANQMSDAYNHMFSADQGLFGNQVQLGLGPAGQNLNFNQYMAGQNRQDASGLFNAVSKYAGSTGGGGGSPAPATGATFTAPPADQNYGTTNWYQP